MTVECSLCHERFDDKEEDWLKRKVRHEEWHEKPRKVFTNMIKGTVTWITIW